MTRVLLRTRPRILEGVDTFFRPGAGLSTLAMSTACGGSRPPPRGRPPGAPGRSSAPLAAPASLEAGSPCRRDEECHGAPGQPFCKSCGGWRTACTGCRHAVAPEAKACANCGLSFVAAGPRLGPSRCACGSSVSLGDRFCGSCGTPCGAPNAPPTASKCACGAVLVAGSNFCGSCGTRRAGLPSLPSAMSVPSPEQQLREEEDSRVLAGISDHFAEAASAIGKKAIGALAKNEFADCQLESFCFRSVDERVDVMYGKLGVSKQPVPPGIKSDATLLAAVHLLLALRSIVAPATAAGNVRAEEKFTTWILKYPGRWECVKRVIESQRLQCTVSREWDLSTSFPRIEQMVWLLFLMLW